MKSCPCCGGKPYLWGTYKVQCSICGLKTKDYMSEEFAILAWEGREEDPPSLPPCPFCGCKASLEEFALKNGIPYYVVKCTNCGASNISLDKEKLKERWGNRCI